LPFSRNNRRIGRQKLGSLGIECSDTGIVQASAIRPQRPHRSVSAHELALRGAHIAHDHALRDHYDGEGRWIWRIELMSTTDLPDPRYKSLGGINKYDKSKAEQWAKAGKIPPAPDFSADTHAAYRSKLAEVEKLARQGDLAALRKWTVERASSSRIAIMDYRDLCIRALERAGTANTENLPENDPIAPRPSMKDGPTNLILYGPPGTGKTYATIEESVKLCDRTVPEGGRVAVKKRFEQLIEAKQIEFVTFHQSYSYEDFVLGLRPVAEGGGAAFTLKPTPGVFYRIAKA
jgi:hypothetical protein